MVVCTAAIDPHPHSSTRVFLAIPVPEDAGRLLLAYPPTTRFPTRWLPHDQLHLTLLFIGEIDDQTLENLVFALDNFSWPKALGIQCLHNAPFPKAQSRLYANWVMPTNELVSLQLALSKCIGSAGLVFDRKRFKPHITLARAKGTVKQRQEVMSGFTAKEVVLYQSELHQGGSRYSRIKTFMLQ